MAEENRLHWADYLVTVLTLVVTLGIGIFFALFKGGQKTKEEYLVGNRQMGLLPVSLSLFVTFQSAITLIGTPADTYNTGTMVFYNYLGSGLAYVVGYWTVVPLIHPLRLTSLYHYLQLRFHSTAVHLVLTCIGMLQTIVYMAVALLTPALVLQAAAGFPLWVSIVVVGVVGTVYTSIGGIKSVMWTDVFQTFVIFFGLIVVISKGLLQIGGWTRMAQIAADGGRLIFDEVDPRARHSVWSGLIGSSTSYLTAFFHQAFVQRICSLKTGKEAQRATLLNIPLNLGYGSILILTGVLLYAYIVTVGCDPYAAGYVTNRNQIIPYAVFHILQDLPGMAGLYMATLFSGALSTFSSGINALAANTVEDLLARPLKRYSDVTATVVAKLTVWLYGAISIGMAYLIRNFNGPVTQLTTTVISTLGSPIMAVFFLAAGFPTSNKYGASGGAVIGSAISLWVAIGTKLYGTPFLSLPPGPVYSCHGFNSSWHRSPVNQSASVTDNGHALWNTTDSESWMSSGRPGAFSVYDVSYLWFAPIGFAATILSGLVISLATGGTDKESLDPKLFFPVSRKLYALSGENSEAQSAGTHLDLQTKLLTERTTKNVAINAHRTAENDQLTSPLAYMSDEPSLI